MATFNVEMRQRVSGAFSDIIYPKAHWNNLDGKPSTYTPTTHTHGNITNDGKIGTTANLVVQTGTGGALTAKAAGTTSQFLRGDGAWAVPEVEGGGGLTFTSIKNWTGNINVGNGGATVDLPLSENISDGNKYIIVWTPGSGMEYMSMFISRASGNISLSYTYGAQNSVHSYGFNISRNLSHLNRFSISGYYDYSLYESYQEFNAGTTNGASFNIVDILKVT